MILLKSHTFKIDERELLMQSRMTKQRAHATIHLMRYQNFNTVSTSHSVFRVIDNL